MYVYTDFGCDDACYMYKCYMTHVYVYMCSQYISSIVRNTIYTVQCNNVIF